jgi:hypothetical protein
LAAALRGFALAAGFLAVVFFLVVAMN